MKWLRWAAMAAAALSLQAQVPDQMRQAAMRGSRGTSGKCTIEVRVDAAAEVDIRGNSGRLRTLAGQPATWTRFECTDPLPRNMADFRFRGIDGRGQVRLVQDPRGNNGVAVVRIDDPRSGSEGYTFDLEWSGADASGGYPGGGFQSETGRQFPGDRRGGGMRAEQAIALCQTELRARAARDYNLRNIEITGAGIDRAAGRNEWVTGTFLDRNFRRAAGYRFNCAVDYNSGRVRAIEILRPDGSPLRPMR